MSNLKERILKKKKEKKELSWNKQCRKEEKIEKVETRKSSLKKPQIIEEKKLSKKYLSIFINIVVHKSLD